MSSALLFCTQLARSRSISKHRTDDRLVSGYVNNLSPNAKGLYDRFPAIQEETTQYLHGKFISKGVYELCTIQPLPFTTKAAHSAYPNQQLWSIAYEASGPGFQDDSKAPRDGCYRRVTFIEPATLAAELEADARRDPTILRDMAERHMFEHVLSDDAKNAGGAWDRYARPPFEEWDSRPGGSTMAFRSDFEQTPADVHSEDLIHFGQKL